MQHAHIYLNFPGNTAEAIAFYAGIFGTAPLAMQTFGEAAFLGTVPPHARDKILHARLPITESVHLMASDFVEGMSPGVFARGNDLHISLVAHDRGEADRVFAMLCGGGQVHLPLGDAPWGQYFGMCVDRFGVQWMVSLEGPA